MKLLDLALVVPLFTLAPSCASLKSDAADKALVDADAAKEEGDEGDEKESPADKLKKAERALEDARVELKIARMDTQAAERKQKDAIEEAEYEVAKTKEALDVFKKVAKPLEQDKLKLSWDRSVQNVEETKAELEELMAMYKKEDFASLTRELVLSRGKKRLEFANRGLEHDKIEASVATDVELPRKEKDLDLELKKAENGLREARAEQSKLTDENEFKLKKAERAVDDAEKDLAKVKTKAAKAAKETKAAQA
ncbi:MAG: hypothetical protein SGI72_15115 [Planctomycetota bacterium]|nr:hypothetical protein [Planctomycetota bacterium]